MRFCEERLRFAELGGRRSGRPASELAGGKAQASYRSPKGGTLALCLAWPAGPLPGRLQFLPDSFGEVDFQKGLVGHVSFIGEEFEFLDHGLGQPDRDGL